MIASVIGVSGIGCVNEYSATKVIKQHDLERRSWPMAEVTKWGWSMDMGPLKRKKTLIGRVRVSKWGWSRVMGPLKRKKTLIGRVRVDGRGPWGLLKKKKSLIGRVRVSKLGRSRAMRP